MNQHFDNSGTDDNDELEKRLAAVSLVAPSENYRQIPTALQTKIPSQSWGFRVRLAPSALACAVALLLVTAIYFSNSSPGLNVESEQLAMEGGGSSLPSVEQVLVADTSDVPHFVAGEHYIELTNPIGETNATSTEVVAFFWYPCWPCSVFEDYLADWESELGDSVSLTRMPAIWSSAMRFHAQAYFTAQQLGVLDRAHRQLYIELERDAPSITNEQELQQFFSTLGVTDEEFLRAYHSQATLDLLQAAELANRAYQIQATPSVFVAGRYGISPASAGGLQEMLEVADFLLTETR